MKTHMIVVTAIYHDRVDDHDSDNVQKGVERWHGSFAEAELDQAMLFCWRYLELLVMKWPLATRFRCIFVL